MPLVLAFGELGVGLLLLAAGMAGASFRQVLAGQASQVYNNANASGSPAASSSSTSASATPAAQGVGTAGPTLNTGNIANAVGNELAAVNPVHATGLTVERVDQGQDFSASSGYIVSPEPGKIVSVTQPNPNSGWEGGGILVEQLASGADVYFAEGVRPLAGLLGKTVQAGQKIADLIPGFHSGVEAGYAAPTSNPGANYLGGGYETLNQAQTGGYSGTGATGAGQQFAEWLKSLGFGG